MFHLSCGEWRRGIKGSVHRNCAGVISHWWFGAMQAIYVMFWDERLLAFASFGREIVLFNKIVQVWLEDLDTGCKCVSSGFGGGGGGH